MAERPSIAFSKFAAPKKGIAILLCGEGNGLGEQAKALDPGAVLTRAIAVSEFRGKSGSTVEILAPSESPLDKLIVVGAGKLSENTDYSWIKLGGVIGGLLRKSREVTIVADLPGAQADGRAVADLASGLLMRSYVFDKYKTRKNDGNSDSSPDRPARVTIQCANPTAAKRAFVEASSLADGVMLARDLVNEPANVLGPVEIATKSRELEALGVKVEILGEKEMRGLGMGSLLGVSQGSSRPPRLIVMQWNGGKPREKPLAFIGKGVVFDSGGVSIKPAAGMEDMKGDMGGAAAVIGLMHALASRKARANVVCIAGCVENMVDGNAQRPGDIVTSMSGQTIEVINTDAEGRLVLADALWYCNDRFQPKFMINLATLTGAIIVALGPHYAGLFCNDDALAANLAAAGAATHERVWRMPLGPEYDKMIDTKNADMKNTGGRHGGSITAAQFLKRFVRETPWAHLDIAGTAMGSPSTEISQSWASGFGVRLLDRLVRDNYES